MRKEVFIAVLLGGALGLAIAFGVWRANVALKSQGDDNQKISVIGSSSPTPAAGQLLITDPEENSLVSTETVTLKGKSEPRSVIMVTSQVDAVSTVSDNSGNWTTDVKLDAGANEILVTAVNEQGEEFSTQITITYSTEFKEE